MNYDIYNPATGEIISQITFATSDEINKTVAGAQQAFPAWANTSPIKRARVLFAFRELLVQHQDELAQAVTLEHGKTIDDAKGSVMRGVECVEHCCASPYLLKGGYSENVATDVDSYTIRQPLGVCVGISPFNFPVMVPVWQFISAIAMGNTAIIKPSEKDPKSVLMMADLLQKAGLPEGVLQVVLGGKEAVEQLITHPDVAAVTAVASTPVAEYIYNTAIAHGKRAHCFGGAKNHALIMPDADIEHTAETLLGAAYGSAGERCMALSVAVVVGDARADALVNALQPKIAELRIGAGDEAGIEMGPLVTQDHLTRVKGFIKQGVQEGATCIVDGREHPMCQQPGFFLGGSLFDHVTPEMEIYQQEIFGPVLCIVRVNSFDEGVALINHNQYGNGVAIFTHDGECARSFVNQIQVGMVGVNIPIPVPVAQHPFGGWKRSVFGDVNMHGDQSLQFYTKLKTVTARWPKGLRADAQFSMPTH